MTYKLLTLPAALLLVSCGASDAPMTQDVADTGSASQVETSDITHDNMDHANHDMDEMPAQTTGDTGVTTGVIRSIGENGDFLTIDHAEIEGVGMGAMTMGFAILSNVDLSGFQVGDRVAFSVKRGRDGSYRITAMCETQGSDIGCLDQ